MKAKLAMKVGGMYRLRYIGIAHWKKLAVGLRLDSERLIQRIAGFAESLPDHAATVGRRLQAEGLSHLLITKLADRLAARAVQCRRLFR